VEEISKARYLLLKVIRLLERRIADGMLFQTWVPSDLMVKRLVFVSRILQDGMWMNF